MKIRIFDNEKEQEILKNIDYYIGENPFGITQCLTGIYKDIEVDNIKEDLK